MPDFGGKAKGYLCGWNSFVFSLRSLTLQRSEVFFRKKNKLDSIPISYNSKFPFEFEEFLSWFGILKSGSSPNHVESVAIVGALPRHDVCHFRWGEV